MTTTGEVRPDGRPGWIRPGPDVAPPGTPRRPRLVCLAYAGRGASVFQDWPRLLGGAADVCAVQLPAREERLHDAPVRDVTGFLDELLPDLRPWLDGPFVLFGHCMGGLLAARLAVTLRARYGVEPETLILSGSLPPWQQEPLGDDLDTLTDGQFIRGLRRAGALTAQQIAEPAVLALMLPAIRADYLLFESTRRAFPRPAEPPLRCRLALFAGDADVAVPPDRVADWAALTSGDTDLRMFPGNHFFLDTAARDVAAAVGAELSR